MRRRLRDWRELVRSLGTAVLQLLRVELEAVGSDLAASGRHLRRGAVLLVLALAVGVAALWGLALLLFELLVLVLPRWGAAACILAAELLAAAALVLAGRRALARVEDPRAVVARRAQEHMDWWHGLLAPPGEGRGDDPEA